VAAIDVGVEDAHFPNKKPIGERLAGLAFADVYGRPGLVRSPEYQSSEFLADGKVRIAWRHAAGLQTAEGDEVRGFAIRGASGPWVWAGAKVNGETVVVWSEEVKPPAAVRYAWARNPVISLVNAARLPLRTFRTDVQSPEQANGFVARIPVRPGKDVALLS
jgi:sialate O-acetylesterase